MDRIKYSIIIAVYNRLEEVKDLLKSFEELQFDTKRFEVLFIDDGSTDGFKEFIKNYITQMKIRVFYQENRGPGIARNNGMKNAFGEYFIFIDSDCFVPPSWLLEIDIALKKNYLDAFGGPDTAHQSFSTLLKAINYSMTSFLGTGGTRGSSKSLSKFYPRSFNMGIKESVFKKIGGMSELRHGQDMDYSQRIYDAGFKVGLVKNAFVYHKRRTSIPKFFRQVFNWGIARINLSISHPSILKPIHLLPIAVVLWISILGVFSLFNIYLVSILSFITIVCYSLINIFAFFQSFLINKSLFVAVFSVLILNIQVFAYGLGLITALWQTKILRRSQAVGFTKGYYGK